MKSHYDIPNIKLTDKYLTDPILLALAWKRAHNYVRSVNWYADNFELDESSLFLQENCNAWAKELQKDKINLTNLELVPAPKSSKWEFVKNSEPSKDGVENECLVWQPVEDEGPSLRPLAHIGIKEQVFFTHLMTCLANTVETKQGNPQTPFEEVHEKGVVNYGNRLYCHYDEGGNAQHNYGGTTIYSKYFQDYRQFLKRPYHFAQIHSTEKLPNEEIFIIELDLEKFFDTIDRSALAEKIKQIAIEQKGSLTEASYDSSNVKKILESFINWRWSESATKKYKVCPESKKEDKDNKENKKIPCGIPQGLVAGGFFANIYLLNFDKKINSLLGEELSKDALEQFYKENPEFKDLKLPKIKLIDYCRYVDDIRLVVTTKELWRAELSKKDLQDIIEFYLSVHLPPKHNEQNEQNEKLKFNSDKTKAIPYKGWRKGISSHADSIQSKASGPLDAEAVDSLISELETMLVFSATENREQCDEECKPNQLASIENSTFDVREDTLRRFATNKLVKFLREKRHFTSREVDKDGQHIAGEWDYLQERIARKLIAIWSQDPALVLLLKKALELFPSTKLLRPVLEQFSLIEQRQDKQQKAIMKYCLAEIYRHSATVIHKKDLHAVAAHADVNAYFELLQQKAATYVISKNRTTHWDFLLEQARFLLLVRLDTVLGKSTGDSKQNIIFELVKGHRHISTKLKPQEISLCILLANQLVSDNQPILKASLPLISDNPKILTSIASQNPDLASQLILHARLLSTENQWVFGEKTKELSKQLYLDISPSKTPLEKLKKQQSLIQLFIRDDNPFANEIMAIKLFQALLQSLNEKEVTISPGEQIDLAKTLVEFSYGYNEIPKYKHFDESLIVTEIITNKLLSHDALDQSRCLTEEELTLRKLAFVIRAALASSKDGTGFGVSALSTPGYRGLKSTLAKRKIGLFTTPESLADEGAQTSGWLTTLLSKLLRWPGIRVNEQGYTWPETLDIATVKKLLDDRLEFLKNQYCQLSNMPVLTELISPSWDENKSELNVVMVQSKIPRQQDFRGDLYLCDPQFRSKHRRHIANVALLAQQHITAEETPADLIIFPELAVHEDDLDVLKTLAQKTHAIIFAGLSFIKNNKGQPINTAIWIVPKKHNGNSNDIMRLQGKQHMTVSEEKSKVQPHRPYQLMVELRHPKYKDKKGFMLTGAICYDATDINLSADLNDKSNVFIVSALNRDVNTFDSMVEALHYHMYQHVVLVNSGQFGGSYAMAPYKEHHEKLIAHTTGKDQITISSFNINMFDFRRDGVGKELKSGLETKGLPAGVKLK